MLQTAFMKYTDEDTNHSELTEREREIMRLIADGMTSLLISEKLCISENTVHNHRVSIFHKLDAHNVAGMIKAAKEKGLMK